MSVARDHALWKRPSETVDLPDSRMRKRRKRPTSVISEECFVDTVTEIIRRDFFPNLEHSPTNQEYLDALESGDLSWITEASQKLSDRPDSLQSRRSYGPPEIEDESSPELASADIRMTLDEFLTKYTSDDNESFQSLLDRLNATRRASMQLPNRQRGQRWSSTKQISSRAPAARQKRLVGRSKSGSQHSDGPTLPLEEDLASVRNALMFTPQGSHHLDPVEVQAHKIVCRPSKQILARNTHLPFISRNSETGSASQAPSSIIANVQDAVGGGRGTIGSLQTSEVDHKSQQVNGWRYLCDESNMEHPAFATRFGQDIARIRSKQDLQRTTALLPTDSPRDALHHRLVQRNRGFRDTMERSPATIVGLENDPRAAAMKTQKLSAQLGGLSPAGRRLLDKVRTPLRFDHPER